MKPFDCSYPCRVHFGGIIPNPTYDKAREGAALAREHCVTDILAVGGGSVVDCCKVVAVQALLDEDLWEMEYGKGVFPTKGLPLGTVVTVSGTGAEMNVGAVITNEQLSLKALLFGVEDADDAAAAQAAVEALAGFIAECGLPAKLGELASREPVALELLRRVADSANLIKTGPVQLTRDDVYDLLVECL